MSKFKKLISLLLMLMLALSVTLSFAACGDDGDDGGDGDGGSSDNGGSGDSGSGDTGNGGGDNTGDSGNSGNTGSGSTDGEEDETPKEPIPTPPAAQIVKTYTIKVVDQTGKAVPGVTVKLIEYDDKGVQKGEKQGTTATVESAALAIFSVVESANLKAQVVSVPEGYVMGTYADGKTTLKYDVKVDLANYEATLTVVKPTGYIITASDADGNVFKGVEITYVVTPNDPATPENEEVKITVVTDSLGQAVLDLPALGTDDAKIPVSFKYESETHIVEAATGEFGAAQYQSVLIGPAVGTVPEKPEAIDALDKIDLKVGETRYYKLTATAGQSIIIRSDSVSVAYGEETFTVDEGAGVAIVPLTEGEAELAVTNVGTTPIAKVVTELVTIKTFSKPSDNQLETAIANGTSAWYEIDYKAGQYVIIEVGCNTAEVVYREHRYTPTNNKIEFKLNENGEKAIFKVIAGAADADALAADVAVKLITPINDETDIDIPAGESIWVSVAHTAGQYLLIDDATVTADGYTFGDTLGAAAGTKFIKLTAGTTAVETAIKPVTPITVGDKGTTVTVKGGKTAWFAVEGAGKYIFIENADAILDGTGDSAVTAISGIIAAVTKTSGKTEFCLTVGDENADLVIKLVDVTETETLPTAPTATKGTTWYKVPADAGSYIFLLDATGKAQITYKGSTVNTANGVISVPVTDEDGYVIFALTFTATETDATKVTSEFSIATIETLAKTEATAPVDANSSVWFVYSAQAGEVILVEGATAVEIKGAAATYADGKITFAGNIEGTVTAYIKVTVGATAGDVTLKPITKLDTASLLDTTKGVRVNVPQDGSARWLQIDYTAAGTLTIDSTKVIVYLDGETDPVAVADGAKTVTVPLELAAGATSGTLLIKVTSEESAEFTATFTIVAAPAADETPAT
jgi:hypothetical protein